MYTFDHSDLVQKVVQQPAKYIGRCGCGSTVFRNQIATVGTYKCGTCKHRENVERMRNLRITRKAI